MDKDEIDPQILKHYYGDVRGGKFVADRDSGEFWLGPIRACYEIAEFGILEYAETNFSSGPEYGQLTGRHRFAIYLNGFSIGRSAESLDAALVEAIAFKRDGNNTQAGRYFLKATKPIK